MVQGLPRGYRLRRYESVVSTNSSALEAARNGESDGLWIVARHQTSGRGSRGRSWVSLEGNLFCSLMLADPAPAAVLGELTFVFALAVHDTLAELFLERGLAAQIALKWPNDVLIDGAKVCGILLESHEIGGRRIVIAGIGINCAAHPAAAAWTPTDLRACGVGATADLVFMRLAGNVDRRIRIWDRGEGFGRIRGEWLAAATGRGEPVSAQLPGGTIEGIFEDIDDRGQLLLRTADGKAVTISSADIFFNRTQASGTEV